MKKIWKFISGVKVTVWLILAAIALLLAGSVYVKANKASFSVLNHSRMQDWFREWGLQNLDKTWWFLALIGVLFLLGINTACCVLDRLAFHWNRRRPTGTRAFLVNVTPTLIHASFGMMLAGHFATMGIGFRSRDMDFVSRPGETGSYTLPGDVAMIVSEPRCEFFSGPFEGQIRQCRIHLRFTAGGESIIKEIAISKPLFWNGFQIHMSQIFTKGQQPPFSTPAFQLLVKRDPGLRLLMLCFPILILLTLFFYIGEKAVRKT